MENPINTCLWFDTNAKEAADFYCSVFQPSAIVSENPMAVNIELYGQRFILLNGGPMYKINHSISFLVNCETIEEVDSLWLKLSEESTIAMPLNTYDWSPRYGWLQDRFGVSWQLYLGKKESAQQKISPSLLFTGKQCGRAEEAIHFYTSLFKNSGIAGVLKYGPQENDKEGLVKHAQFNLGTKVFMATDSSAPHQFTFNEAVSFMVGCDTQEQIDYFWNKLAGNGGEEGRCGWLKDKFGVSWQIIPNVLSQLMSDPEKTKLAVQAFMPMKKFEIGKLLEACKEKQVLTSPSS